MIQFDTVDLLQARGALELSTAVSLDLSSTSYESLLALLRRPQPLEVHERIQAEIRSRDRAYHNQRVQHCGEGEFK